MTASKIPIKKVCEHCKQEFIALMTTTKYCSHRCNSRAYKAQKREERVRRTELSEQEKKVSDIIDKPYLSISEAGRLLGISRHTIYRYIYSGNLKAYNLSSQRSIVKREDIERMLVERPYEKRQPRDAIVITRQFDLSEHTIKITSSCKSYSFVILRLHNDREEGAASKSLGFRCR